MSKTEPQKRKTQPEIPTPPAGRFVISHRLAGRTRASSAEASRAAFDTGFQKQLAASVRVLGDSAQLAAKAEPSDRRVIVFEGDAEELRRKRRDMSADIMIEPERPRASMVYNLAQSLTHPAGTLPLATLVGILMPSGTGTTLGLKIIGAGAPVKDATVTVILDLQERRPADPRTEFDR